MQHHTAPPNPFPVKALYRDNKIKCNVATHEDGTVYLVAYEACNYSSGKGSSVVLNENVRPGVPPTANAASRGLTDDMGGNRYFWNYENSHPGDGSSMSAVQSEAIALSSAVVNAHFGITEQNMIAHSEWSGRKTDPYYDGSRRIIDQIRSDTAGADMATPEEIATAVWERLTGSGITSALALDRNYRNINELILAHRSGTLGADLGDDDIEALVDAIVNAGLQQQVVDGLEAAARLGGSPE